MQWKTPKNTSKYHWTQHVVEKMHYYGLSEQKVLGVIRNPKRTEIGIVENTVAVMVPVGNISKNKKPSKWSKNFSFDESLGDKSASAKASADTWNQEIWVMYQLREGGAVTKNQAPVSKKLSGSKEEKLKALKSNFANNNTNKKIFIISAWRYPGVSSENNPIPEEILREIEELAFK